jgi:AraC-like DNA-binding protein
LAFVREHVGESLSVPQVAKIAGFSPSYFAKLFVESEKTTFQRYVQRLRVQ